MEFSKNPFPYGKYAEEVLTPEEFGEYERKLTGMVERYPVLEKWFYEAQRGGFIAEELLSKGAATVVALVQTQVIDNVFPMLVGRQVSTVVPVEVGTAGTSVTFYRRKPAFAAISAGVGATMRHGARYDTQEIKVDEIIEESMEWDRSFVEDVPFAVALDGSKEVARIVAVRETTKILSAIEGLTMVTAANSPQNVAHTSAGTALSDTTIVTTGPWADLATAVASIEGDDGMADFALLHSGLIGKLWQAQAFVHQFIFGDSFDVKTGVLGESYLGFKIVKSSLVASRTVVSLGNSFYVKVPIKRELLTNPYENPAAQSFGYIASERLGSGVLQHYGSKGAVNDASNVAGNFDFYELTSGGWIS